MALFDVDKDSSHVRGLLSALKIPPDRQGDINALVHSDLGITAIIDIVQRPPWSGIAIPAHVTSSKGILEDIRGNPRTEVIRHPSLIAVEATCFQKESLKDKKRRAVDLLDGTDEVYQRKLAVYQASDNPSGTSAGGHGLEGIGSRCAYFKVEKISLDSLKQCFLDPDVRIVQDFEFRPVSYPRIGKVRISGGFLENQQIVFHAGLNSIIGGKGTGKSLIVELMRFALDQSPDQCEMRKDHDSKLEQRLGMDNYVELEFIDVNGRPHLLKQTYNLDGSQRSKSAVDRSRAFPVLFLSQSEIIKIAEKDSEQLNFIDRFFDFRFHRDKIRSKQDALRQEDSKLGESLHAVRRFADLSREVASVKIELDRLDEQLSHPIFKDNKIAEEKNATIENQIAEATEMQSALQKARDSIASGNVEISEGLAKDSVIQRVTSTSAKAKNEILTGINALIGKVATLQEQIKEDTSNWTVELCAIRALYDEHVSSEGGDYEDLAEQRATTAKHLESLRKELSDVQAVKEKLTSNKDSRDKELNELEQLIDDFRAARVDRCNLFQDNSNGRLRLSIKAASNTAAFEERLLDFKTGSRLRDQDIEFIANKVTPRSFIDNVLSYYLSNDSVSFKTADWLEKMANDTNVSEDNLTKLVEFLIENCAWGDLLELQYRVYPEDLPEIEFNIGNEIFRPLQELSVGQKCTALLIMALTDGQMPVVIDQPEDALDIVTIWDDICSKVRQHKISRQFIFTTHNSNVAVASDTDNYIIMDADSERGRIVNVGSMDHDPMKDNVLIHMEGGTDSYLKKSAKYQPIL